MPADDSSAPGSARRGGVLGSLKHLLATVADIAHTRLQLLANELEEESLRLARLIVYGVAALIIFLLGIILLTLFVIVLFWDSDRVVVLGGIGAAYLLLGVAMGMVVVKGASKRSHLFKASLNELAKDAERLSS